MGEKQGEFVISFGARESINFRDKEKMTINFDNYLPVGQGTLVIPQLNNRENTGKSKEIALNLEWES